MTVDRLSRGEALLAATLLAATLLAAALLGVFLSGASNVSSESPPRDVSSESPPRDVSSESPPRDVSRSEPARGAMRSVSAAQEMAGSRFDGAYGLFVSDVADTVEVRWLTSRNGRGSLTLAAAGSEVAEFTTPPSRVHAVTFPRPGAGPFTIVYGELGSTADRHETTIWPKPERASPTFGPVDSVFAVGDVHGEYDTLLALLRNARMIDSDGSWIGGRSHLVFLGDLFDRGADVTRTLWFIYGLEKQAERAGGRVHVVLGNHEIMVLTDDLRYVSPKELDVAEAHGIPYARLYDVRRTVLGRWLATKPALIRIGRVLFAHGGVAPPYAGLSLQSFDDSLAAFMSGELFYRWGLPPDSTLPPIVMDSVAAVRRIDFFFDENSVFWYRGYLLADTLQDQLKRVLARHDSDIHVVAHTAVDEVAGRYEGTVLAVDMKEPATQLLLLVREREGIRAYRYGTEGPPEPLEPS